MDFTSHKRDEAFDSDQINPIRELWQISPAVNLFCCNSGFFCRTWPQRVIQIAGLGVTGSWHPDITICKVLIKFLNNISLVFSEYTTKLNVIIQIRLSIYTVMIVLLLFSWQNSTAVISLCFIIIVLPLWRKNRQWDTTEWGFGEGKISV